MTASSRPPFLYPPGSPLMHSPLALTGARMYGFWVLGDVQVLQASVDATLGKGSGQSLSFVVVSPFVLMTFTDIARAYSEWPDDRAKGWGREVDIVAWVWIARTDTGEFPPPFYAYPIHIWVDDCMALIVGREVFGYPKYLCDYTMPGPNDPPVAFTLAAKGFQPYAPQTELAVHPLLEVTGEAKELLGQSVADVQAWRCELLQELHQNPDFWAADPSWRAAFDQSFMQFPALNQIFLKQFPDASGQLAVYQAIVSAGASVQAIHGLWLLGGQYQLTLRDFATFPLAQSLGWKIGAQKAYVGFRVDFDFVVEPGVELAVNGAGAEGG